MRTGESQQPSPVSQASLSALPVKSFSSVTMKIVEQPSCLAGLCMISLTAPFTDPVRDLLQRGIVRIVLRRSSRCSASSTR